MRAAPLGAVAENPAISAFDRPNVGAVDRTPEPLGLGGKREAGAVCLRPSRIRRPVCTRRTRRLQKFVDLVKTSGITPGLTQYAHDNWPYKPQEFYAETYSLWLTESDFLKSNSPVLFNFFDSGDYAK